MIRYRAVLTHRLTEEFWLRVFSANGVEVESWSANSNLNSEDALGWATRKLAGAHLIVVNDWHDRGGFQNEATYEVELRLADRAGRE
jgi:hypothetical protein